MNRDNPERDYEGEIPEGTEPERKERHLPDHFESTYSLKPNEQYEANEYRYETDRYGRITRCEGTLRLEDGKRNTNHQTRSGGEYRLDTDVGGHLIAREFGGSGRIDNLVPMDGELNQGKYRSMEKDWEKALKRNDTVDVEIRCYYSGASERPTAFTVKYRVTDQDGYSYTETRKFKNGKDGGG